jgi:hypothetical protein
VSEDDVDVRRDEDYCEGEREDFEWTDEMEDRFVEAYSQLQHGQWTVVAEHVGGGVSADQCAEMFRLRAVQDESWSIAEVCISDTNPIKSNKILSLLFHG